MARNVRKIAIATTLVASIGGGIGVSHAAGVGPTAARYDVKSASWYTDNAVRAWGVGDTARAGKYLAGGANSALFRFRSVGGPNWVRTGVSYSGNKSYVTYKDSRSGAKIQLTVTNSYRSKTNKVITYVNWWEGRYPAQSYGSKGSSNTKAPAYSGGYTVTTAGYGPATIGKNLYTLQKQGLARNVFTSCGVTQGYVGGAHVWADKNGRIDMVMVPKGASTRSGVRIGDSLTKLKRTYGSQLHNGGPGVGYNTHMYYLTASGSSLTFFVSNGVITHMSVAPGSDASDPSGGVSC